MSNMIFKILSEVYRISNQNHCILLDLPDGVGFGQHHGESNTASAKGFVLTSHPREPVEEYSNREGGFAISWL